MNIKPVSGHPRTVKELRTKIAGGSKNHMDYTELARFSIEAEQYEEAISLYERGLKLAPTDLTKARFCFELAYLYLWMEKLDQAAQQAKEMINLLKNEKNTTEFRYLLGMAHGLVAQAAMEPDEAQEEARKGLAWLTPLIEENPNFEGSPSAFIQAAHLNNMLGNTEQAKRLCRMCLEVRLEPSEKVDCLFELIEALRFQERFEEAAELTTEALKLATLRSDKLLPVIYSTRGLIFLSMDRLTEAHEAFERAMAEVSIQRRIPPRNDMLQEIYWNLGEVYYKLKVFDRSISIFRKLLSLYPSDDVRRRNVLGRLGQSCSANRNFTDALKYYDEVLQSSDASEKEKAAAHQGLGEVYYDLDDYDAALSAVRKAVSIFSWNDPAYGDSLLWLGASNAATMDYKAASDCYRKVLESSFALEVYKEQAREKLSELPEPYNNPINKLVN